MSFVFGLNAPFSIFLSMKIFKVASKLWPDIKKGFSGKGSRVTGKATKEIYTKPVFSVGYVHVATL